ncbi:MAG: hypothetical protein HY785_04895 [Oscillatoriophycideae cyanobacterium NC_groundwater_1537_Pr4_S-0.65um_50_18]|nr:hypothetical protein [Oscillatoriophycideae cyanobacterium NC_groundwater_1537_Pr4_S-0.65um_50_18]
MDDRVIERWSREVAKNLEGLNREVNDLRRFQANVEYDKQVQTVLEIISRLQTSNASYTNLILAAGYAAFFAFWSTLKSDMPIKLYATSGLLMVLSLMFFIAWEIIKMIWTTLALRSIEGKLTSRPPEPDTMAKFQQEINAFDRRIGRLWIYFLFPTITCGITSGLCLVGFFVWKLVFTTFN